ncbi:HAD family hydrolase [Paraneptunicella aestuarii]|uniref:HAD family hydrolase n=1 Tax=Paraneptunicella aestuarii TaxID=2831148 RepID=UPI001E3558E5|nr:HAD family hydrolase [Paraneptunicella aestuarii]UAA39523.1 HAD family hydrolase [Paraneptunicella aestuarii]
MLRIGIDFDNTIVNYDGVFHKAAVELGWLPEESDKIIGTSKEAVKNYFIERDEEPRWTELQGIVYGKAIVHAKPFQGLIRAIHDMLADNMLLFIVSHKTQYPIIGDKLDFHEAAKTWLAENGIEPHISQIYFCPEKDEKIQQISDLHLDWFIDDLPSILNHQQFPEHTKGVLFDPDGVHPAIENHSLARRWSDIPHILRGE